MDNNAGGAHAAGGKGKDDRKNAASTPKVGGSHKGASNSGSQIESTLNMLELTVNPAKPATYPCFVILKSLDRTDIRLYEFKVNAIP